VYVIDRRNHHLFQPLLYQVATAALHPGTIAVPIRSIFRRQRNCKVFMAKVVDIDLDAQTVRLGSATIDFDYLLLATGYETNYFGNDAWEAWAPGLKSVDEAVDVRARFQLAFERAELDPDEDRRRKALTFAIVGAGPTGVELAGAVAEIATSFRKDFRRVDTTTTRVVLLDLADRVLPPFHPELSARAQSDLEDLGVEVVLEARVTRIDETGLTADTPNGPLRLETQNVVWAAGVKGSQLGRNLGCKLNRAGRVLVGPDLAIPGHPNVFVAGDLAHRVDERSGRPVPAIAQGAIQGGRYVGRAIAAEIKAMRRGQPTPGRMAFRYSDRGSMAIIGRNRAVADVAGLRFGGYVAFLMWALIHILFLISFRSKVLVFVEWVWLYLTGGRGARLITGVGQASGGRERP
jgi:NADH dehydrogenase